MKNKRSKISYIFDFFKIYFKNELPSSGAEMAYFLVFAFFPLLMVIYASFSLALQTFDITKTVIYSMLPSVVENLIDTYIEHINSYGNIYYLFLGIFLTLIPLSNVVRALKTSARKLYNSKPPKNIISEFVESVVLSLLVLAAFYVSLILLILGGNLLSLINRYIDLSFIMQYQSIIRFLFTLIIIYFIVTLVYYRLPNVKQKFSDVFPGSLLASLGWIIVSWLFSFYMNNFTSYSIIYGSIGAFIMLLLWIYISCIILLAGAVLNSMIYTHKYNIKTELDD